MTVRALSAVIAVSGALTMAASPIAQSTPRTGAIQGVVVDATGKPIPRARLALTGPDVPGAKTTVSDDKGRFAFTALGPGRFDLVASRSGYLDAAFGERHPHGLGTPIRVAPGQQVNDLRIRLARGATISGTILDASGAPSRNAAQVYTQALTNGELRERQVGYGVPDANGAYRVTGLAPGSYSIRSMRSESVSVTLSEEETRIAVNLREGAASASQPTTTISGVVEWPAVRATQGISVEVNRRDPPMQSVVPAKIDPSGHFMIEHVPAGEFVIVAHAADFNVSPGQRTFLAYWAEAPVVVDGRTPAVVTLTLEPGVKVSGTLVWEGAKPPDVVASKIFVDLLPSGPIWGVARRAPGNHTDQVLQDGRFLMTGVPWGQYSFRVLTATMNGTIGPWVLESAMLGDRDVLDVPLEIEHGHDVSGLVLTMTDRPAMLSGSVRDRSGHPTSEPTVIVFPADQRLWSTSTRRIRASRPDTSGEFFVADLPAGNYLVATVPELDNEILTEPKLLAPLAAVAMHVSLAMGEARRVSLEFPTLGRTSLSARSPQH